MPLFQPSIMPLLQPLPLTAPPLSSASSDLQTLRTVQAALGKGCLASSFICVYLFTGELYPTEIR